MTSGTPAVAARATNRSRSPRSLGKKPSVRNGPSISPEALTAAARAEGPGIGDTRYPAASAAVTRSAPGSETAGVPASVIKATSPDASASRRSSRRLTLVVLVVADSWRLDREMREQAAAMPGILGRNQGDLAQDANCPRRQVLQIPDRRRHDVERAQQQRPCPSPTAAQPRAESGTASTILLYGQLAISIQIPEPAIF